jgi:hypothetical protein
MPGERHLLLRREDAYATHMLSVGGRIHERHLGEVELPRDREQQLFGDAGGVREDGELVAAESLGREDVESEIAHR